MYSRVLTKGNAMQNDELGGGVYLPAKRVRERYGDCSDMTLWRWLNDPSMDFPRPLVINKRRLWKVDDLLAWERDRAMQHGRAS